MEYSSIKYIAPFNCAILVQWMVPVNLKVASLSSIFGLSPLKIEDIKSFTVTESRVNMAIMGRTQAKYLSPLKPCFGIQGDVGFLFCFLSCKSMLVNPMEK